MKLCVRLVAGCFVAALLIAGRAHHASAALLVSDDFSNDGALEGSTPDVGGNWTENGDNDPGHVQVSGGRVILNHTEPGVHDDARVSFTQQPDNQIIYARYDLTVPSIGNDGTGQMENIGSRGIIFSNFRVDDPESGTSDRARIGFLPSTGAGDFKLVITSGSSDLGGSRGEEWTTELDFDTTYTIVSSYDPNQGLAEMWVDPVNASSAKVTTRTDDRDRFGEAFEYQLRQDDEFFDSEGNSQNGAAVTHIDNLCVATSFGDALHCVPEPALLPFFAAAVVGLIGRRSRS